MVVVCDGCCLWRDLSIATLTMRDFSELFLDHYLAEQGAACLGSVGGYQIEGGGLQLFAAVEGDWLGIMGLPLLGLLEFLREQGIISV
ncbi:hypothetical protein WCLP8_1460012 [uncultured Gammaproteobacteria bacterium]